MQVGDSIMPRRSRFHSPIGVYHIMMRGNEKKDIFIDNEDKNKFLDILSDKKLVSKYKIYAYCLMNNHIHLILKECDEALSMFMKRINVSYAYYFNKKYNRVGHLFQDRFKSECIDSERYLLSAVRYVHNNPVKAKIVDNPGDYPWSSYNRYINTMDNGLLIDRDEILSLFSSNTELAVRRFILLSQVDSNDSFIDYSVNDGKKDLIINNLSTAKNYIEDYLDNHGIRLDKIKNKSNNSLRNSLIAYIKSNSNLLVRDIGNLLNLDRNMVSRAK
jgi:putative transposase